MKLTTPYIVLVVVSSVLWAGAEGRRARSGCRGVQCSSARCVDAVMDERGCCRVCPDGNENCILFGAVIPANQLVVRNVGQCQWSCRCPGNSYYEITRERTTARCHQMCQGSLETEDEVAANFDLLVPANLSKKRTFLGGLQALLQRSQMKSKREDDSFPN